VNTLINPADTYNSLHPDRRLNAVGGDNNGQRVMFEEFNSAANKVRDDYNSNVHAILALSINDETNR
jgi:hypothetical protein